MPSFERNTFHWTSSDFPICAFANGRRILVATTGFFLVQARTGPSLMVSLEGISGLFTTDRAILLPHDEGSFLAIEQILARFLVVSRLVHEQSESG